MLLEFQRDFAADIAAPASGPMRVYQNTVLSGCVDALRANYPIVARLIGAAMFNAVAADHAMQCPPSRPVLALYGARFPDWLEEQSWITELRYIPDVARIERMHIEALFAPDAEPIAMAALSGTSDWQSFQLPLHPATRFDWLASPALSIWLAQRDEVEGDTELDWHAEGVLFTRPWLDVQPLRLDRAGLRFLLGIRRGEKVGAAAIAAAAVEPATDIAALFTSFVQAGAFAANPRSLQ